MTNNKMSIIKYVWFISQISIFIALALSIMMAFFLYDESIPEYFFWIPFLILCFSMLILFILPKPNNALQDSGKVTE